MKKLYRSTLAATLILFTSCNPNGGAQNGVVSTAAQTIQIKGTIDVVTAPLFQDTVIGASFSAAMNLKNTGSEDVTIQSITLQDADHFAISNSVDCTSPVHPPGDAKCVVQILFQPALPADELKEDSLIVTFKSGSKPSETVSIPISGKGISNGTIAGSPAVSCADTQIGLSTPATLTLINTGSASLTISQISTPQTSNFQPLSGTTDHCSGTTLTKNQTCTSQILFSPTLVSKSINGQITVKYYSATDSLVTSLISISGKGLAPPDASLVSTSGNPIVVSSTPLNTSMNKTIVIKNTGPGNVTGVLPTISGPSDFSVVSPTTSQSLAANATLNIVVRFTPNSVGLRIATLAISYLKPSADSLTTYNLSLRGTGICNPSLAPFGAGDGSPANPYLICSVAHLDQMRTLTNASFRLAADIDLSGTSFQPMGGLSGTLDGAGYTISNWTYSSVTSGAFLGLIKTIGASGVVKNLKLTNFVLTGPTTANAPIPPDGILSASNWGLVENVQVTGSIVGRRAGGIVGENSGTLSKVYANVSVTGMAAGAITCTNWGNAAVRDSYSAGTVSSGSSGQAAGLVGGNTGLIERSYSIASVVGPQARGLVSNLYSGTSPKSYWDTQTSGSTLGDGVGKTSLQMKSQSTYVDWDFNCVWQILPGAYPTLRGANNACDVSTQILNGSN